jgi:hypothetical protein
MSQSFNHEWDESHEWGRPLDVTEAEGPCSMTWKIGRQEDFEPRKARNTRKNANTEKENANQRVAGGGRSDVNSIFPWFPFRVFRAFRG